MNSRAEIAIGIMSGTSLDGIDLVACRFHADQQRPHDDSVTVELLAQHSSALPSELAAQLLAITDSRVDAPARQLGLATIATLEAALSECYANACGELLQQARLTANQVMAIGCHGQTVMHLPPPHQPAATLQLNDPARLAVRTGIPVVADFRRADIALGGQGAPLVPAFHRAVFAASRPRAVCNIGGIANLTLIHGDNCSGFDCGPGNALMDSWCQRHLGQPFDRDGGWAATGKVNNALLEQLLSHPFLAQQPPKSCGREQFNHSLLANSTIDAADIQATLLEFTALTICGAIGHYSRQHAVEFDALYVCGGGAENGYLMERLQAVMGRCQVASTAVLQLPPQWVEAAAFAWLARQRLLELPGNLPAVTGAAREAILGGLYLP